MVSRELVVVAFRSCVRQGSARGDNAKKLKGENLIDARRINF